MMKAKFTGQDGRPLYLFGLSRRNTELLLDARPIMLELDKLDGPPCTVVLMGGETEDAIVAEVKRWFPDLEVPTPDVPGGPTVVHDPDPDPAAPAPPHAPARQGLHLEDLESMAMHGCETPGCTTKHKLDFAQRCHLGAGAVASYQVGAGKITIACFKCRKLIAEVAVAPRDPAAPGPTGRRTRDPIRSDDGGETAATLRIENGAIVLDFGRPIAWLGMTAAEARAYAGGLRAAANRLDALAAPVPPGERN